MLLHVTGIPHHPEDLSVLYYVITAAHIAAWMTINWVRSRLRLKTKQININVK